MTEDKNIRKKTISVIGCGGGGSRMVNTLAKYLSGEKEIDENFQIEWYLYDLSSQIIDIANNIKKDTNNKIVPLVIRPTLLDAGAGGIPLCAEIAFENNLYNLNKTLDKSNNHDINSDSIYQTNRIDWMYSSSLNIFIATLGGGTGGRTISQLIPELRNSTSGAGSISDIGICILTDQDYQNLNHIYNYPFINKEADFLILFENGIINEKKALDGDSINERATEIIDLLISIRHPDTLPKPFDGPDFTSLFKRDPEYATKRWLVPFVYPVEGYDNEEYKKEPILFFIDKAFESIRTKEDNEEKELYKRCLCKVEKEKIKECSSCVVIIKAPEKYIQNFLKKTRDIDGRISKEVDIFLRNLERRLDINRDQIIYKLKPDERGFKICILLQNVPIMKIEQMSKYLKDDWTIKQIKNSWLDQMNNAINKMVKAGDMDIKRVDEIKLSYQKKFENLTDEFVKNYCLIK